MNPVHYWKCMWWFWDETWSQRIGPYAWEEDAEEAAKEYAKQL